MTQSNIDFGFFRSIFWPIHRHELKKLLPMLIMLFFICFNYTALRNLKDAIVVPAAGAEVIPFTKVWMLLPMSIFFTLIFIKLSNRFSQEIVFYLLISGFLLCYFLFAFVIFPLEDRFQPHEFANELEKVLPSGFKGLISMLRYWPLTLFYVFSELWSTIIMTVLFKGFANEITTVTEAHRFYGIFSIGSNFAAISAAQAVEYLIPRYSWEDTIKYIVMVMIILGSITMVIFYWMNRTVLKDPSFADLHRTAKKTVTRKKKLSLRESYSYLSTSKYILCIAVLVVAYNLVINLVEVVWKDQLRTLYPESKEYSSYNNSLTTYMAIISTISSVFMAKTIGRFGWTSTALVTPLVMLVTSAGFFGFLIFQDNLINPVTALIGTTPLAIAVFFGSAQNCFSKAAKYSFFDTTKEMAFIPLDHETKLKGKAAIDGVGSRLGKSGGSLIHQGLLLIFVTLSASAPYLAAVLLVVIMVWIIATRSLGKQFQELTAMQEKKSELITLQVTHATTSGSPARTQAVPLVQS